MTERQQYLEKSHISHVEEIEAKLVEHGFELTELAEWYGHQPHTEFVAEGGYRISIFGHARCELYRHGVKIDGCRIHRYAAHTLDRLLSKVECEIPL